VFGRRTCGDQGHAARPRLFSVVHDAHDDPELLSNQEPDGTGTVRSEEFAIAVSKFDECEEKHYVKASSA